jgi:death-on-curing protein
MEVFLVLNGYEIDAGVDDQEKVILKVASGEISHEQFADWLNKHVIQRKK